MKKQFPYFLLYCCGLLFTVAAFSQPPIRTPLSDAKKSIAAKAAVSNINTICKGLATETPAATASSTGASGYYSVCNASNTVIFYLQHQKISVLNSGLIRTKYASQDFERGPLGFPVADAVSTVFLSAHQNFENGAIYSYPNGKEFATYIVRGGFYKKYLSSGGENTVGRPVGDEQKTGNTVTQNFEKGTITQNGNSYAYKSNVQGVGAVVAGINSNAPVPGEILANAPMVKSHNYYSADNRYFLVFQDDGNLVLYKVATKKAIWSSHTNGIAVKTCLLQGDGNLVMYGYNNKAVWSSDASLEEFKTGGPVYKLEVQNDGNLVIYACNAAGHAQGVRWASGTAEKN